MLQNNGVVAIYPNDNPSKIKLKKRKYCHFLPSISLGKNESPLYYRGATSFSSPFGGVATLLIAVIFITIATLIFVQLLEGTHFNLEEETILLNSNMCCDANGQFYNFHNSTNSEGEGEV